MKGKLIGIGRVMFRIPEPAFRALSSIGSGSGHPPLAFMTADHHRVRDFAVLELPRRGGPLPPEVIARDLDLPLPRVVGILDDLERHMTFVYRNPGGAVVWAYPVTVEPTPHRITLHGPGGGVGGGEGVGRAGVERLYAA